MNKVKQLFRVVSDDDGHNYLVPNDEYGAWYKNLSEKENRLEDYMIENYSQLDFYLIDEMKDDVYECYNGLYRLEGEKYYVVLQEDIIE